MDEKRLIGWLCIARLNVNLEEPMTVPEVVADGWVSRGWVEIGGLNPNRANDVSYTAAGRAVVDLHGPDWGIGTIPIVDGSDDGSF